MNRTLHRWLGLLLAPLVLVAALTAVALNHQGPLRATTVGEPGLYGRYLKDLAVDPERPQRMLAGTDRGLFLSEDGGKTWREVAPAEQVEDVEFQPGRPAQVWAACRQARVLRSDDGGLTWADAPVPFGPEVQVSGLGTIAGSDPAFLTSAGLYRRQGQRWVLEPRPPKPEEDERRRGLLRLIYGLHDGQFWGRWGVLITDVTALGLVALVLTGSMLRFRRRRH